MFVMVLFNSRLFSVITFPPSLLARSYSAIRASIGF